MFKLNYRDLILSSGFFAPAGKHEAAGVLSTAHFLYVALTALALLFALKRVKRDNIRKSVRRLTLLLWLLEAAKIFLCIKNGNTDINETVPLYYCSITLYAGLLSGFCGGKLRRMGDVFLASGGVVGGVVFLALPLSSFSVYPPLHFITLQSVFLHGCMVYMGLALVLSGVELTQRDILYYAPCVLAVCVLALIINGIYGSNLMFISQNYPSTPIEILYKLCPGVLFTVSCVLGQLTLPFYGSFCLYRLAKGLPRLKKDCRG